MIHSPNWQFLGISLIVFNLWAFAISSTCYLTWTIKTRNTIYYFVFKKRKYMEKVEKASLLAEEAGRWFRPICHILVTLAAVVLSVTINFER